MAGARGLNQLSIKHNFMRLILFGGQPLWYVTKHRVCVCACVRGLTRVRPPGPPLTPHHSPAHVPPPAASKEFCVCQSRKSLNELVEAIVQSQSVGVFVCWFGGGGGGKPTHKELFTVQTHFPSLLHASSISDWC